MAGLVATDGCLSKDARHIDITSKDRRFLKALCARIASNSRVCSKNVGGRPYARVQLSNKSLYEFFLSIGLMPRKSLVLGKLAVPDTGFADFLRGVIDGDGSIRKWKHPGNKKEQWSLRIYSGSREFIGWLQKAAKRVLAVRGRLYQERRTLWTLKYGKMVLKVIARRSYYDGCFGLPRKTALATACLASDSGWKRSKTVLK